MKLITGILFFLLLALQAQMWIGDGSFSDVWRLQRVIDKQQDENVALAERNSELDAEVRDLKHGLAAIEEHARSDLGMTRKDETFFQIVEK